MHFQKWRNNITPYTDGGGEGMWHLCSAACLWPMHGCSCNWHSHFISKRHDTVGLHAKLDPMEEGMQVLAACTGINHWGKINLHKTAAVKEGECHKKITLVTLCDCAYKLTKCGFIVVYPGQVQHSALSSIISSPVGIDICAPERKDYSLCNGIKVGLSQNYITYWKKHLIHYELWFATSCYVGLTNRCDPFCCL